jgi:hypothetical protein
MSKSLTVFCQARSSLPPAGLIQQPCSALRKTGTENQHGDGKLASGLMDVHKTEPRHLRGDLVEVGLAPAREEIDGRRDVLGQVVEELDQVGGGRKALGVGDARVDVPEEALKVDEQQPLLAGEEVLLERVELEVRDVARSPAELAGVGALAVGEEFCREQVASSGRKRRKQEDVAAQRGRTLGPGLGGVVDDVGVEVLPPRRQLVGRHLEALVDRARNLGVVVLERGGRRKVVASAIGWREDVS